MPSQQTHSIRTVSYLTTIIDSIPTAVVVVDQAGAIVLANAQTEVLFGYTRDEILGRQVDILVPHRFRGGHPHLRDGFIHHPTTRPMGAGRDLFGLHKDGSHFPVEIGLNPITTNEGLFVVSAIVDITERKKHTEELQQSEIRFRTMFDNSAVGISIMRLDGKIIAANPALCKMLGYALDEIVAGTLAPLIYPDDFTVSSRLYQDLVSGSTDHYIGEQHFLRKSGESFWAQVSINMVRDTHAQPLYLMALITDIDEQKQTQVKLAEQEAEYRRTLEHNVEERTHKLAEANQQLKEEIKQRTQIEEELGKKAVEEAVTAERNRLARDLHDAVTQTLFSTSLIAEILPELWETNIEEAKNSTEELRQLTRGALAEMRTLLLELRPATLTQVRLSDLIKQLCEAFIGRSRLPIVLNIEGDLELPPEVQVAFYRIAQESLNNVFKYARATQVDVKLIISETSVHFETCDNGIGFDTSTSKTTSMGMRIMRERADTISADLRITSKPGSGTCVAMTWHKARNKEQE